jgi:hypothetical protein
MEIMIQSSSNNTIGDAVVLDVLLGDFMPIGNGISDSCNYE